MSRDQKVMTLLPPMENYPITYRRVAFLFKFDNSSSSVTRDKEIYQVKWANDITTTWGRVPNGTLSMMFIWCPNLMFLALPWLELCRFSNKWFCYFEQFKVDIYFANFREVSPFCWLRTGHGYFIEFG